MCSLSVLLAAVRPGGAEHPFQSWTTTITREEISTSVCFTLSHANKTHLHWVMYVNKEKAWEERRDQTLKHAAAAAAHVFILGTRTSSTPVHWWRLKKNICFRSGGGWRSLNHQLSASWHMVCASCGFGCWMVPVPSSSSFRGVFFFFPFLCHQWIVSQWKCNLTSLVMRNKVAHSSCRCSAQLGYVFTHLLVGRSAKTRKILKKLAGRSLPRERYALIWVLFSRWGKEEMSFVPLLWLTIFILSVW